MFIEQPPMLFRALFPEALFRVAGAERCVYLTFDDGPIPQTTPRVLDILSHYDVKATFFMVGDNVARHRELFDAIVKAGHSVGNHTMNHLQGLRSSTRAYLRNISQADELIGSSLFRPPHGWLTPWQMQAIHRHYTLVMYDVVTRDYSASLSADDVVGNVRRYTRNGSIIVFHDSLRSMPRLFDALPRSIEWLLQQGYRFKTLEAFNNNK